MASGPAVSWEGVREISRAPPRSDWAGPIKKVLRQVHPDISRMDADALLLVCDLIDYCLHRVARRADELASGAKFRTAVGKLGAHRVLAHRILPHCDEFLIVWGDEDEWMAGDVSWESREDALSAGIDLAAFEQKPAQEVEAEFERFAKDFESANGEPFAPDALDARCIQGAVRHFLHHENALHGELAKHAESESTKAVTKATSGWSDSRTDSRTKLAGLQFPVDIVGGMLASICCRVVRWGAAVYLTASLEYLCSEVLELAGDAARHNRATAVHVQHIFLAIEKDEELSAWGSGLCLMGGGVLPYVHERLFQALTEKDLAQLEADDAIDGCIFVTGVSLATGKRVEGSAERDGGKPRKLAPVAHWSDQQMNEVGILKFRDQPRPRSLPQGVQPLSSFLCPITLHLMKDPVTTSDGYVTPPVPVLELVNILRVLVSMLVYADSAKKAVILWTLSHMER